MTIFLLISPILCVINAQDVGSVKKNDISVSDVLAYREGHNLIIDYDLLMGAGIASCEIELMMNVNGDSFRKVEAHDRLTGDIGRVYTSGSKRIIYDIDAIKNELAGKNISFKVQVKNKKYLTESGRGQIFMMGTASTIGMYGLRTGYVKKWGGYIAYNDSFSDYMNGGDTSMFNSWNVTGGFMMQATSWFYPYVGAGYGMMRFFDYYHEDYIKTYETSPLDYYYDGEYDIIPFEIGSMFRLGRFTLSAAVEPVLVVGKGFLCTFEFGVGCWF